MQAWAPPLLLLSSCSAPPSWHQGLHLKVKAHPYSSSDHSDGSWLSGQPDSLQLCPSQLCSSAHTSLNAPIVTTAAAWGLWHSLPICCPSCGFPGRSLRRVLTAFSLICAPEPWLPGFWIFLCFWGPQLRKSAGPTFCKLAILHRRTQVQVHPGKFSVILTHLCPAHHAWNSRVPF